MRTLEEECDFSDPSNRDSKPYGNVARWLHRTPKREESPTTTATPLDIDRLDAHLQNLGIRFMAESRPSRVALFGPNADRPFELQVQFALEGAESQIYVIRMQTPRYYPAGEGPALLALINRWNREQRWPKVYLHPTQDASMVSLVAETQIPVATGIHDGALGEFTEVALRTASSFFFWITEQHRPANVAGVDAQELERLAEMLGEST